MSIALRGPCRATHSRRLLVYNFHMLASTRDDVVTKIKANRRVLKRYGVKSLALFGSAARNKMRKGSDIDILVQFDKSTWANYVGLKFYLEDLLERDVDLVTPKALKPATRPSIVSDAIERAVSYVPRSVCRFGMAEYRSERRGEELISSKCAAWVSSAGSGISCTVAENPSASAANTMFSSAQPRPIYISRKKGSIMPICRSGSANKS